MAAKLKKDKFALETLFDAMVETSCRLRKTNPTSFDGQSFWLYIKNELAPFDEYTVEWKKINALLMREIMSLSEYTLDGNGNKEINEINHFIIQQVRIPTTEKASIRKIIQLALNIGQLKGSSPPRTLPGLGVFNTVDQFIHKKSITALSSKIPRDTLEKCLLYLKK